MKLASWNVNGLRARINSGHLEEYLNEYSPDILGIQETKLQEDNLKDIKFPEVMSEYYTYYNFAEKPGYSGTAIYTKVKPIEVYYGIGLRDHDTEGRVITAEFDDFYFLTVYTPNSGRGLPNLDYRMDWEDNFRDFVNNLAEEKPVLINGDLNVAHKEIDLANPDTNRRNAGFTDEERRKFTELLESGWIDTFRYFYPDEEGAYSWWAYWRQARARNIGWRIDYFLASDNMEDYLVDAKIHNEVMGSDHCPVSLVINFDMEE